MNLSTATNHHNKNEQNEKKHGIFFEEARTVFFDENAVEFFDEDHSDWEDRFRLLGLSARFRILMICHCFREEDSMIHIISTRKAHSSGVKFL
ncbi:MAG: BrnT family toxin [bacterium]|nr:BrnT family toxin [bacterium]